jgi:hypothetical protein
MKRILQEAAKAFLTLRQAQVEVLRKITRQLPVAL